MPKLTPKQRPAHEVLGVSKDANLEEIKKAYKKLALKHHPDRHAGKAAAEIQAEQEKFTAVNEAYRALTEQPVQSTSPKPSPKSKKEDEVASAIGRHEANQAFDYAQLIENINKLSGGKGKIQDISHLPTWISSKNTESMALMLPEQSLALPGHRYQYKRDFDGKEGVAILDLSQPVPVIMINPNSDESMKAGVELAKASGATGLLVPDNLPKEKQDKIKEYCKEYNMTCDFYPSPKSGKNQQKVLEADVPQPKAIEASEPSTSMQM